MNLIRKVGHELGGVMEGEDTSVPYLLSPPVSKSNCLKELVTESWPGE